MDDNSDFIITPQDASGLEHAFKSEKYSIGKCIYTSEKGFAKIYLAKRNGRLFILKGLREEFRNDPVARAALKKEYDISFSLDLPGIVNVFDLISHEEIGLCIVMKYYSGKNLRELINSGYIFNSEITEKVFKSLVKILKEIHKAGIVHRDIKPSNIIFNQETETVTLLDFGCADSYDQINFKADSGTPFYKSASLESAPGEDWYALSKTLEEVVSDCKDKHVKKVIYRACRKMETGVPPGNFSSFPKRKLKIIILSTIIVFLTSIYLLIALTSKPEKAIPSKTQATVGLDSVTPEPTIDIKSSAVEIGKISQFKSEPIIHAEANQGEQGIKESEVDNEKDHPLNPAESSDKYKQELDYIIKGATQMIWWEANKKVNKVWKDRTLSPEQKDSLKKVIIEEEESCKAIKAYMKNDLEKIIPTPDPAEIDRLVRRYYRVMFEFFDDKGIYGKESGKNH